MEIFMYIIYYLIVGVFITIALISALILFLIVKDYITFKLRERKFKLKHKLVK